MFVSHFLVQVLLLLFICLAKGYQQESKLPSSVTFPKSSQPQQQTTQKPETLLNRDKSLSPIQAGDKDDSSGLVEVKEDEIPEGSPVYVLEEPEDQPTDMEIMQTANNIVFRPLFRYRGKQEALRRNGQRLRRRYFVPSRFNRQTYRYPYYYPTRYY